jgi:hypothetical protein
VKAIPKVVRVQSSGMCYVVWYVGTNISKYLQPPSLVRFLQNVGTGLPNHTALHLRRAKLRTQHYENIKSHI